MCQKFQMVRMFLPIYRPIAALYTRQFIQLINIKQYLILFRKNLLKITFIYCMHVVRRQFAGTSLNPLGPWSLNLGHQTSGKVLLPTELSLQPNDRIHLLRNQLVYYEMINIINFVKVFFCRLEKQFILLLSPASLHIKSFLQ